MANVSTKQLAHQFDKDIFAAMPVDYPKICKFLADNKGTVAKMIADEPFSERSIRMQADRYIDITKNTGKREHKAFMDGMNTVLFIIQQHLTDAKDNV